MKNLGEQCAKKGVTLPGGGVFAAYCFATPVKQILKPHNQLSMTVLRKSVIAMPAVRTIFGTSEASVIPGMVFISRK